MIKKILNNNNIYKKFSLVICLFISLTYSGQNKFRLNWTYSTEDLSFLKLEKALSLEFVMDSFLVKGQSNKIYYEQKPDSLKRNAKQKYIEPFNGKMKKRYVINELSTDVTCKYKIVIKPVKFYVFLAQYSSTPNSSSCKSEYVKGDYLIEIYEIASHKLMAEYRLSNLTNKYPMGSTCSKYKYSYNMDEEINRSMIRAGTETAKYILQMIRRS